MAHLLSVQGLVTTFRNEGKEFNAIEGVNLHVDPVSYTHLTLPTILLV